MVTLVFYALFLVKPKALFIPYLNYYFFLFNKAIL